jgi:hypothetical protein
MKKLEVILITGAVIGLLLVLFNVPLHTLVITLFFPALGVLYYCLGFALFNGIRLRSIFKADSYKGLGLWRILIAIGTGIGISNLTIGFMFSIMNYPLARALLIEGSILTTIFFILAIIKNARDKNQFYRKIMIRCLVFLVIGVIFILLPGQIFGTS